MKKLALSLAAVALTVFGLGGVAMMSPAYAVVGGYCPDGQELQPGESLSDCDGISGGNNENSLMSTLSVVINVVLGVVGFVAVVMIIIGGISFVTSQGDTAKVTKARNTILYGVVGLIVAILAFAIVNFVLSNVFAG